MNFSGWAFGNGSIFGYNSEARKLLMAFIFHRRGERGRGSRDLLITLFNWQLRSLARRVRFSLDFCMVLGSTIKSWPSNRSAACDETTKLRRIGQF